MTDPDPPDSLLDSVRRWIEKGGHVLEMEVAAELRRVNGSVITQGYPFTDPLTGTPREGDVTAYLVRQDLDDKWNHSIELLIECKSSHSPWVAYAGSSSPNGPWAAFHFWDSGCGVCLEVEDQVDAIYRTAPGAYAITSMRGGEAADGKDHAYSATHQVASAALGLHGDHHDQCEGHDEQMISSIAVCVVVTRAPLVLCSLKPDGTVDLEQVERVRLDVPWLNLPDDDTDSIRVLVVTADGFPALLDDLHAAVSAQPETA